MTVSCVLSSPDPEEAEVVRLPTTGICVRRKSYDFRYTAVFIHNPCFETVRNTNWLWLCMFLEVAVFSAAGCGSTTGPARFPIRGTVRIGSVPASEGQVRFVPSQGHTGPVAATSIRDGRYEFSAEEGPTAGPHDVSIVVQRPVASGSRKPSPPQGPKGGGDSQTVTLTTTARVESNNHVLDLQFDDGNRPAK